MSVPPRQLKLGGTRRPPPPRPLSVSQLVRQASRRLESQFGEVWVEGEVSNLSRPRSGHLYFTLKDDRSQLSVVLFRSSAARLRFEIQDGQQIRCRGRLGIYDVQGRFQLTAETAEPTGVGALQAAFEQLKAKLAAEGLFSRSHKKPLPLMPRAVAVVTSPTGAAVKDIVRVLHQRCPVRVVICPTPVQGSGAAMEIVEALRRADSLGLELIIVGRGGGSLEDLQAFNNEGVARAIFTARTPIISAVGHEVDVTIADMVADARAPTPTAAAELAVPVMQELKQRLDVERRRLQRAAEHSLGRYRLDLERLHHRLGTPQQVLNRSRLLLDETAAGLEQAMADGLSSRRQALEQLRSRLAQHEPRVRLARHGAALQQLRSRLVTSTRRRLEQRRAELAQAAAGLQALSPLAVLSRGYSVVLDDRRELVRSVDRLAVGDGLTVRFHRGEAACRVERLDAFIENEE